MVIRGLGYYRNGRVVTSRDDLLGAPQPAVGLDQQLHDLLHQARKDPDPSAFVWLGLYQPTRGELTTVAEELRLNSLHVEDALNVRQRAKAEVRDGEAFVVFKVLRYIEETSDVETGQIAMFLGPHFVVTVRYGAVGELSGARERLEKSSDLLAHGTVAALYVVLDSVVDGYVYVADELEKDIDLIQESVFSANRSDESEAIYRLKRELLEMRRAVSPLVAPAHAFLTEDNTLVPHDMMPYFRDISDHLLRVNDQVDGFDNLLTTLLSASTQRLDLQQNSDMRKISAWVAIAAVPTMIAGVYGMNFENMPELHWKYGYFLVVGLMLGACGLMYRAFKRSGWL